MTNAVDIAQMGSNNVTFRNRIINGGMVIDQRNAGASATPASSTYSLDRWQTSISQASKFSFQQNAGSVTPPTGFSNYLGVTSASAYSVGSTDIFLIRQPIEGFNTVDLGFGTASASTVTLSFWVRSSLTGTFGGALYNSDGTRSYPFIYTISSANTWTQISITIAGDTSGTWVGATNGIGLYVSFSLGAGSSRVGTAGSWASAYYPSATGATSVVGISGATFYITGVQLEAGTTASPFEYRQYGTETYLCKRYYQKSPTEGRPVGSMNGSTTGLFGFVWEVEMRAAPTIQYYGGNTAGGTFKTYTNGNATNVTSDNGIALSAKGMRTNFAAASGNGGGATWIDYGTGTDQMGWAVSAEL